MPVEYKQFNPSQDVTTTKTLLHEVIPITGSILSGTYGTFPNEGNIKNYSHGMFQSVYDYPYLSSSANHIIDLTVGYDEESGLSGSGTQNTKKINLYNQYAQVLLGYTGSEADSVRKFENDLNLDQTGSMKEVLFLSLSRLITKDQIKKGSFQLSIGTGSTFANPFAGGALTLYDANASDTGGTTPVQGGDYASLFTNSSGTGDSVGNIFYQAGIVVLTASVFGGSSQMDSSARTIDDLLTGSAISASCDAIRHRISNLTFNNTTEINSKIYFCRAPFNRFNYSTNPTYTSGSKIVTKNVAADTPIAYITTIGLYSSSGELLATAKLSEPLRKDPTNELTLRVRLDY
jgi:hypothetical protein